MDIFILFDYLGRLFTSIITFSFGMNMYFWRQSQLRRGKSDFQLYIVMLKRAALFFLIALFFNATVWEYPRNLWDVDIMFFYFGAAPLMPLVWRLTPRKAFLVGTVVVLVSTGLGHVYQAKDLWVESRFQELEFDEALNEDNRMCLEKHCDDIIESCYRNKGCSATLECMFEECDGSEPTCMIECAEETYGPDNRGKRFSRFVDCATENNCMSEVYFKRSLNEEQGAMKFIKALVYKGHFSLLPWIAFPIFGFGAAQYWFKDAIGASHVGSHERAKTLIRHSAVFLVPAAAYFAYQNWIVRPTEPGVVVFDEVFLHYPQTSFMYVLWAMGMILLILGLYEPLNRGVPRGRFCDLFFGAYMTYLNRYLLTIYYLQHLKIIRILRWYSLVTTGYEWHYFEKERVVSSWTAAIGGSLYPPVVRRLRARPARLRPALTRPTRHSSWLRSCGRGRRSWAACSPSSGSSGFWQAKLKHT